MHNRYRVIYNSKYQITTIDSLDIKGESMIVDIGNNFSESQSNNKAKREAMIKEFEKTKAVDMGKVSKTKFDYQILKDKNNNQFLFFKPCGVSKLYYANPLGVFDWQLVNEEKDIKGYKCKKTTTIFAGRDYIAWHSLDIPISDGPYKFNGFTRFDIRNTRQN